MLLIGLMSGTSADGIDATLVEIEGEGRATQVRLVQGLCFPHTPGLRNAILDLSNPDRGSIPDLCALNVALGGRFAEAARYCVEVAGVAFNEVAAIASHGQTVWHQPEPASIGGMTARGTLQIGSAAVMAARTGCRVVSDFRAADMAAGGQGAPLVPYFDWAILSSSIENRAVLNLGGIANVTYLPRNAEIDQVVAFDTGPGNVLINALVAHYSSGARAFDKGGLWAAEGSWAPELGEDLLREPYFSLDPPKSTGRELFSAAYVSRMVDCAGRLDIRPEDVIATVTELTARTITDACSRWLPPIDRIVVSGGGIHNSTLMALLRELLQPAVVVTLDDLGFDSDAKEAMAFALLGYETLHGRPSNVPSATGASRRVVLGSLTPPP